MPDVNWLAVVVAAVSAFVLGGIWYGPLFKKTWCREAGVAVSFAQAGDNSHNARKVRQLAGNAVANGLPWEAGLAGLTRVPARVLGVDDELGTIEIGQRADLVLWTGDPLEVSSVALQLWLDGRAIPMESRQTELRDRYLRTQQAPADGGLPRAYPAR